jgi:hypothetical protein
MNKKAREKKRKKRSQGVWTGDARWKRETDGARGRGWGEVFIGEEPLPAESRGLPVCT